MHRKALLQKRVAKLQKHHNALRSYHTLIMDFTEHTNIFTPDNFKNLTIEKQAVLDAYLKRFASLQDYLGAKIFPLILELAGIGSKKMSEILYIAEREEIIDNIGNWIELREIRNELEHEYPDTIEQALLDLKFCVERFDTLDRYYQNTLGFIQRHLHETF